MNVRVLESAIKHFESASLNVEKFFTVFLYGISCEIACNQAFQLFMQVFLWKCPNVMLLITTLWCENLLVKQ